MNKRWKNSTEWENRFLRRMLSWICRELDYPRRSLMSVEFGNRTNVAWSGRAFCGRPDAGILVRIGPAEQFPCTAKLHGDGWSVGKIADRLEALIMVTAHEVAHCDNARRNNKSRRSYKTHGALGGSERLTDARAKQVLDVFRTHRDELLADWSQSSDQVKVAKSAVQKRAENAFAKEAEWEKKLKTAKSRLAKWRKKANYYRNQYPHESYCGQETDPPGGR